MSDIKHTPGPWVAEDRTSKGAGFSIIATEVHFSCCGVAHYVGQADARLIAAAPELLEACKRLIGSLGVMICDPDNDGDILFSRAAIAKATGKE